MRQCVITLDEMNISTSLCLKTASLRVSNQLNFGMGLRFLMNFGVKNNRGGLFSAVIKHFLKLINTEFVSFQQKFHTLEEISKF